LFREPQRFVNGMLHDHLWHPRMRRSVNRRASISISEILGPDWQNRSGAIDGRDGNAHVEDAALTVLKRTFAAQELALNPGLEWMHEASLDTTGAESPPSKPDALTSVWEEAGATK
jgi:hypothetical protein